MWLPLDNSRDCIYTRISFNFVPMMRASLYGIFDDFYKKIEEKLTAQPDSTIF